MSKLSSGCSFPGMKRSLVDPFKDLPKFYTYDSNGCPLPEEIHRYLGSSLAILCTLDQGRSSFEPSINLNYYKKYLIEMRIFLSISTRNYKKFKFKLLRIIIWHVSIRNIMLTLE